MTTPVERRAGGYASALMFLFFSNRSGCMGSLMISAVVTILLLLLTGVID